MLLLLLLMLLSQLLVHLHLVLLLPCTRATLFHPRASGSLPVQRSTCYSLGVGCQGPTRRKGTKGGVLGLAEDLRPVSEVEAGVNFRPGGCVRGQVAGSLPGRQPGTGNERCGSHLPSTRRFLTPQFVPPGRGLGIRQSMGWTKLCGTARSRILVLKGDSRTRVLLATLDRFRVEWMKRGIIRDARARLSMFTCVWT